MNLIRLHSIKILIECSDILQCISQRANYIFIGSREITISMDQNEIDSSLEDELSEAQQESMIIEVEVSQSEASDKP